MFAPWPNSICWRTKNNFYDCSRPRRPVCELSVDVFSGFLHFSHFNANPKKMLTKSSETVRSRRLYISTPVHPFFVRKSISTWTSFRLLKVHSLGFRRRERRLPAFVPMRRSQFVFYWLSISGRKFFWAKILSKVFQNNLFVRFASLPPHPCHSAKLKKN